MNIQNSEIADKLNTALQLHRNGRLQEAEAIYKEILQCNPNNPDALYLFGILASQVQQYDIAVEYVRKALEFNKCEQYYIGLGNIYASKNDNKEALNSYLKALELNPNHVELHNKAGSLFSEINEPDKAIYHYEKAIKLNPQHVQAYYNLGNAYMNKDNFDEAGKCYKKALELSPDYAEAYYNLGAAYNFQNNFDEAIKYYKKAIELSPQSVNIHYNLALAYLLKMDFENGWRVYEQARRVKQQQFNIPELLMQKEWDGKTSIKGKTIYTYHEQGIGDTIFSLRYLPVLKSMGAKVLCKPQKGLEKLLEESFSNIEIIDPSIKEEYINFDFHVPLYYLTCLFRTNTENIPLKEGKYLKANPDKVNFYKENYFNNDNFKIGIFWQGNPEFYNDRRRSVPLEMFYGLNRRLDVKIYSFQKGSGVEKLDNLPEGIEIVNLGNNFEDFSDTAAAVENIDLMICVDTAITHLAGAMGKPAWILVPFTPDWRWFLHTDECLWYESVKIFRQKETGNWDEVMNRIFEALNNYVR